MNWVTDSLSAGRLVEETKYEIEGDLKTQKGGIARKKNEGYYRNLCSRKR